MSASYGINWNKMCRPAGSFEGVPHHTSGSAEGRSATIKGHSVYPEPASVCLPDVPQLVFHLLTRTLFFIFTVFCLLYIVARWDKKRKKGKSTFSSLEGVDVEIELLFICLQRLKDFGPKWKTAILLRPQGPGPLNTSSINASALVKSSTHVRTPPPHTHTHTPPQSTPKVPVIVMQVFPR